MSGINYLDGSIYHMVHIDNLTNIFRRRAILSNEKVLDEKIGYHSIAFEDVQGLRDRVYARSMTKRTIRPLHSYVPIYFTTLTPMLYVQHMNGIQNKIVYLEVNRSIMEDHGVLFTDGNDHWFTDDEKKRIKHAEVLVPDIVPLGRVEGIYARTLEMVRAINAIIDEQGLTGRIPNAIANPELYFY